MTNRNNQVQYSSRKQLYIDCVHGNNCSFHCYILPSIYLNKKTCEEYPHNRLKKIYVKNTMKQQNADSRLTAKYIIGKFLKS